MNICLKCLKNIGLVNKCVEEVIIFIVYILLKVKIDSISLILYVIV